MDEGFNVFPYKCGPDYIDPSYHKKITYNWSINLDPFLQGEDAFYSSLNKGLNKDDSIAVVEGVMGFYDGSDNMENSAFDISNRLALPVILVISPKGLAQTQVALLKGLLEFRPNNIKGLIFNKVSERYYLLLKRYIEEEGLNIEVLGYVKKDEAFNIESRNLGLIAPEEVDDLEEKVSRASKLLKESLDIKRIIEISSIEPNIRTQIPSKAKEEVKTSMRKRLKCAIALDRAFSFYYKDSLDAIDNYYDISYFSPLKDEKLPPCDLLYIGGGYPEIYKEELAKNKGLLKDIKEKLEGGLPSYCEGGGLAYLFEEIEGVKMVGFYKGLVKMTNSLQNFGYTIIEYPLGKEKLILHGHEFHKSIVETNEKPVARAYSKDKKRTWEVGYLKKATYSHYAHINLKGSKYFLDHLYNLSLSYNEPCK